MCREGLFDDVHFDSPWIVLGTPEETINKYLKEISREIISLFRIRSRNFVNWALLSDNEISVNFTNAVLISGSNNQKIGFGHFVLVNWGPVHVAFNGLYGFTGFHLAQKWRGMGHCELSIPEKVTKNSNFSKIPHCGTLYLNFSASSLESVPGFRLK